MRIILATGIYPPESGGPATYTHGLALALRERGHEVVVVAYGEGASDRQTIRVSRRGGPSIRYIRYAWRVFLAARRADVVYAQGPVSEGLPATIGAKLAGRPLIMKVVGDYAWEMAQQRGEKKLLDAFLDAHPNDILSRIERWTARRATRVIVPSRYLATVVGRWGVPSIRIDTFVNAVDPLPSTAGRDDERRALGVLGNVVILTAVRAVPWKGVSELIGRWKDVPLGHLLVVAGDGPELDAWKSRATSEGVADRVRFLGRVDRQTLARWYDAADAFVLNSGYEGYPHVVAEAASRGLPCFVSDKGGNPETVEEYEGLVRVIPYNDMDAWISAISGVDGLSERQTRMPLWTHGRMVDEIEHTLKETLGMRAEGKMQVVMVSYDRALLDHSSETSHRVLSIADAGCTLNVIVMRGRIFRNVVAGIRHARQLSGRTIVTAQDPFAAGLVGYLISRWTNSPLEVQEHGDFYSGAWTKESWKNRVLSRLGRFILKRAERVRTVSERVKDHLIAIGVPTSNIEVISVAQNLDALLARPFTNPSDIFRIVAPCRFVGQKGLETLLSAARLLKQRGTRCALTLVGSGPLEAELKERIRAEGLSDDVAIEPWRDPSRLWDAADLFVLSSNYEGWGRTIVEAMAAGVPIVTTDVGCVGPFFRPQIDGRVVQPNDPVALAKAIEEQMAETNRRETMRASARERAKSFPSQQELHAKQTAGWRGLLHRRDIGPRWDLWVAALIAFIILSRIASVALFHASLLNREWGFYYLVDHWLQGYGYSYARELGCASAYRSPGYLFFLTALYRFFSPDNTLAQAIVQNIVVIGVLWLVYAVGKRLVGARAALLGAFLMAAYPYTFYHYTQYYHTFLSSFFLLLMVWFLLRIAETERARYAIGAGLSIGCLAYVQGTILPATPFIVAWLLYRLWPHWCLAIKATFLMATFSVALIAPWTYRNWTQLHAFVPLTTDLGHGLFKANNEVIYELTKLGYPQEIVDVITVSSTDPNYKQYRMPPELEEQFKRDGVFRDSVYWTEWHPKEPNGNVATCAELGPMNEVEFNQHWTGLAKEWIRKNWMTEGWKLHLLKLKTFWQPSLFPSVKTGAPWSFAGSPIKVWIARNAVTVACAIVIFGGWIGMLFAIRRRDKNVWLPIGVMFVYSVLHTFFAGYTKYRIPLDNLLAAYAGWTIVALWDWLRGTRSTRK